MRSVIDASEEWMARNLLLLGSVTVIYPLKRWSEIDPEEP